MMNLPKISVLILVTTAVLPRLLYAEGFGVPDPRGSGNYQIRSMLWSPDSTGYSNYNRYITVGRVWSGTQFLGIIGANKSGDDSLGVGYEYFGGGHDTNFAQANGFGVGTVSTNTANTRPRLALGPGIKVFDFAYAHTTGNAYGYDNLCTSVIEVDTTNHYYVAGCRSMRDNTFYNAYLVKFDENGNLITGFGTQGIVDTGIGTGTNHGFLRGMVMDSTTAFTVIGASGTYTGNNMQPVVKRYNASTGADISLTPGSNPSCTDAFGWTALGTNVTPTAILWDTTNSVYHVPVVDWKPSATGVRRSWHHVYSGTNLDEVCARTAGTTHPFFSQLTTHTGTWASYNDVVLVGADMLTESGTTITYYAGAARINDGTTAGAYSCLTTYVAADGFTPVIAGGWGKFLLTTTNSTSADNVGATLFNPQDINGRPTRDCILNDVRVRENVTTGDIRQYVAGAVYNGSNYDFLTGILGDQGNNLRSLSYGMEGPENDVANRVQFFSTAGTTASHENFYTVGRAGGSLASTSTQFAQAHALKVENKESWVATSNTSAPAARASHAAVWSGSKMLVWGGLSANGAIYDPVADTWGAMATASQPTNRSNPSAVWSGSAMYIWGGYDGTTYYQDGQKLTITSTTTSGTWSTLATLNQPTARTDHSTAVVVATDLKPHMVIWGGVGAGSVYASDGSDYNITDNTWTALPASGLAARSLAGGTGYYDASGPAVLFWGGWNGTTYYSDGRPYLLSGTWGTQFTNGTAAYGSKMNYDQNRRIMRFGGNASGTYQTGYYMDVLSSLGTWTAMNATGMPGGRTNHIQLWNGAKLFVWGGQSGSVIADGSTYDVRKDSWTAITTTGGSSARQNASGVWSGEKMIVWGGNNGADLAIGGQYSPSTTIYHPSRDVWTATQNTGVPTARVNHSTVFTGRHMIVWGGQDASAAALNSGSRYDPVANSWAAVDTTDADTPSARLEHTAVWTGSEMIVWGGRSGTTSVADGARYNPAEPGGLNNWIPVTATGAPTQRFAHSAVWAYTGASTAAMNAAMVIYGGENTGAYRDDAVSYSTTTGAWFTPLTLTMAARRNATMWFDGLYVGVWGGYNGAYLTDGTRYNVKTAATSTISVTGAPTSPAVGTWTGKYVVFLDMMARNGVTPTECGTYTDAQRSARYDPFANTWATVSATGIPTCRAGGSYIWTGSKLLVYGGVNSSATVIDGGALYDPIYNVWSAITTNSSAAKWGASAVWTGKEAMIWGGSTGNSHTGATTTGARYQR